MNIGTNKYSDKNNTSMDVRSTVITIVSVTIGVILVGSLLVPQAASVIEKLQNEDHGDWASLVSLVVTITIIGIVVAALYMYTSSR